MKRLAESNACPKTNISNKFREPTSHGLLPLPCDLLIGVSPMGRPQGSGRSPYEIGSLDKKRLTENKNLKKKYTTNLPRMKCVRLSIKVR